MQFHRSAITTHPCQNRDVLFIFKLSIGVFFVYNYILKQMKLKHSSFFVIQRNMFLNVIHLTFPVIAKLNRVLFLLHVIV